MEATKPQRTPCNTGYTFPDGTNLYPEDWITPDTPRVHPALVQQACETCPLLQTCAHQALTSGATIDRNMRTPANGVIQAGVVCEGDQHTLDQLRAIAGTFDVIPLRLKKDKPPPPTHCHGCNRRMITRPKGQPLDHRIVTHAAHGYCRTCYATQQRTKGWVPPTPTHMQKLA